MFHKRDMVLTIDSYAAYLVEPQACIKVAGYFKLTSNKKPSKNLNGAILIKCKMIYHVFASSAKAKTSGIVHNAQIAIPLIYIFTQMRHPYTATLIKTDNTTDNSFVHENITQKNPKSWGMRLYWSRNKKNYNFGIYWVAGHNNLSDYYKKHHKVKHNKDTKKNMHKTN